MSDLLLKATPELLEGWCGPVVVRSIGLHTVAINGRVPDHPDNRDCTPWHPELHLDLARAECRDRVVRVVLAHVRSNDAAWPHWAGSVTPYDLFALALGWGRGSDHDPIFKRYGLKRNDNASLLDGSRLVDAQALLAVAQEVLHG